MSLGNFFLKRWNGQVPWRELLWHDMLGVGTVVNLLATFVALIAAIKGAATVVVALLHFAPLPYNFFLFAALWRMPQRPGFAAAIAGAWLLVVMFI
jgi:hypothetical protein